METPPQKKKNKKKNHQTPNIERFTPDRSSQPGTETLVTSPELSTPLQRSQNSHTGKQVERKVKPHLEPGHVHNTSLTLFDNR